ncbi:ABC transporter permease [Streptomyces sp. NPDC127039]|uniref:ABC transporter permease n=1 Tax=Streptomyces sp. NPDC127039 TaxID=3347115 RepID=UPI00365D98D8
MTSAAALADPSPVLVEPRRRSGARRLLVDTAVIARRNISKTLREPESLLDVTVMPIMFILLFGYVIGPAISLATGSTHTTTDEFHSYLIPGMLGFTMVNAAGGSAVAIAADMGEGIIDRFRSLPMSRAGVLLGRSIADLATSVLAIAVVAVTGVIIGWRPHHGVGDTIAAFALVLLFAYAIDWLMLCLGLVIRNVEGADQTRLLLLFLLGMVSTALVPVNHLAGWLQAFAYWNPVSVIAAATRHLFGNPDPAAASSAWTMQHPVAAGLIWSVGITAVFAAAAVRLYRTRAGH